MKHLLFLVALSFDSTGPSMADELPAVAVAPTVAECVSVYTTTDVVYMLAPVGLAVAKAGLLPQLAWAMSQGQKLPKQDLAAGGEAMRGTLRKLVSSMQPTNAEMHDAIRRMWNYYDPPCSAIAGLAPSDYDSHRGALDKFVKAEVDRTGDASIAVAH